MKFPAPKVRNLHYVAVDYATYPNIHLHTSVAVTQITSWTKETACSPKQQKSIYGTTHLSFVRTGSKLYTESSGQASKLSNTPCTQPFPNTVIQKLRCWRILKSPNTTWLRLYWSIGKTARSTSTITTTTLYILIRPEGTSNYRTGRLWLLC